MNSLSSALRVTESACGAVTSIAASHSKADLQTALKGVATALAGILGALSTKPKAKIRIKVVRRRKRRFNGHKPALKATAKPFELRSSWDPSPLSSSIEASRCQALLLEIMRRSISDWVLYRTTSRLPQKRYAEEAFIWLFVEDQKHPLFRERELHKCTITSFEVICELNDLEPDVVRRHIRTMNVSDVMGQGRPPERRRRRSTDEVSYIPHDLTGDISLESLEPTPSYRHTTYFESYYAPNILGYA